MSDHKNKKILLVDDEADILEFVSYNLTKEGYDVSTANNGKEAIQKAKELKPHLIILDVMMPEMDGIETCAQMREIDDLNNTIIAFLTARGEDYSQIAGFDAGGDDYITKPIKPKVLISRVKALLKRYKTKKVNHQVMMRISSK
jgi:two-component system alkaline phosphatase synthesis response regulator PhoP